jgi:hypothetical protein
MATAFCVANGCCVENLSTQTVAGGWQKYSTMLFNRIPLLQGDGVATEGNI